MLVEVTQNKLTGIGSTGASSVPSSADKDSLESHKEEIKIIQDDRDMWKDKFGDLQEQNMHTNKKLIKIEKKVELLKRFKSMVESTSSVNCKFC
jgi:hypothetical protein